MEQIFVRASKAQQAEWLKKPISSMVEILWVDNFTNIPESSILFDLLYEPDPVQYPENHSIVVNAVITGTDLPSNYIRINAWSSFLERNTIELSGKDEAKAKEIMLLLGWNYQWTLNEPGFISARTIAMIINEAYFALGENVANKEDIDTAMKLGTNYPYGPFEWGAKIGLESIYQLLKVMSKNNERYLPAPALTKEATPINS
jgi:3-hydroxybutyryl-CoA dehydrogenase